LQGKPSRGWGKIEKIKAGSQGLGGTGGTYEKMREALDTHPVGVDRRKGGERRAQTKKE